MNWIFYAILSAVFASLVGIFGKVGLQTVDSTLATSVRAIIMALFLFIVAFFMNKYSAISTIQGKPLLFIFLSGIVGALSWLCYFFALKYGPASKVASLDKLSVVFVLIFALLFLGEQFKWTSIIGATLITGGAILMIF